MFERERLIEEVVLNGTVQRFSRAVQTKKLKKVIDLTDVDYQTIDDNISKCSTMFLGHDSAGALIKNMPDAEKVKNDIQILIIHLNFDQEEINLLFLFDRILMCIKN